MTPDQAQALVDRIAATWRGRLSTSERAIWADALVDLDHQAAEHAVDKLACTEARRPPIAAIRLAAGHAHPATQPGGQWQVLVTWRHDGREYADPRRWHSSEQDALADYETLVFQRPEADVTILRHHPDRALEVIR